MLMKDSLKKKRIFFKSFTKIRFLEEYHREQKKQKKNCAITQLVNTTQYITKPYNVFFVEILRIRLKNNFFISKIGLGICLYIEYHMFVFSGVLVPLLLLNKISLSFKKINIQIENIFLLFIRNFRFFFVSKWIK